MKSKIPVIVAVVAVIAAIFFLLNLGNGEEKGKEIGLIHMEIEEMPKNIQEYLEQFKMTENYLAFNYEGEIYLFASRGEMISGGYSIVLKDATVDKDTVNIIVEKKDPGKDDVVTQALTYPVKLVKLADNTVEYKKAVFMSTDNKKLEEKEIIEIAKVPESLAELYFGTEDGYFRKEKRIIDAEITPENAYLLIEELIKGPENINENLRVLPEGTKILSYKYDAESKVATIDLGGTIKEAQGSMGEIFAVYSIVNTLADIEGIDKVQILIEGEIVESLSGHIYLGEPLDPDYSFLEDNKYK
jgi:germination protein M